MLKDVTKEDELELTTSLRDFASSRPEGEGIFSGMDSDETGWVSVRPYSDEVKCGTLIEACSRQDLVPSSQPTLKRFDCQGIPGDSAGCTQRRRA
ncbi:hypothetical protein GQ600_17163 [Phytophthora cactorum]|nr:hypothetical protein GQ600_17163 [Phytophthora cactorum]